jgi:geranylgeranyl diphosphate synthase type II
MCSETEQSQKTTQLESFLSESRMQVDTELNCLLPAADMPPERVHQAIRWSVFAGGKRFRPALLLATGQAFGAPVNQLVKTASALEMIHTYSLIHDDLPSMDNDDLRRGLPTCHIRFDEATAILAGDALQSLAFRTIAQDTSLNEATRVRLIGELAIASGTPEGMVAGQAMDIEAEAQQVSGTQLEEIHRRKTGALIAAAARSGAIIAQASVAQLEVVSEYAAQLGLLFQITDDLLDVIATAEDLGKTPGKDARSFKATYPGLYGIAQTRNAALAAHSEASKALKRLGQPATTLQLIADFILHRTA